MQESSAIVQAYDAATAAGLACALASVVHVQGSSYRRPGARMLVTEIGQMTGAISGGCLEGDALRKAVLAMSQGKNKLVVYDTTDDEDASIGIQLGCNGIVSILFEPLPVIGCKPIEALRQTLQTRLPQWVCTVYAANHDSHLGTMDLQTLTETVQDQMVQNLIQQQVEKQESNHFEYQTGAHQQMYFLDYCLPPIALYIVGAGNDAIPLLKMSKILGWHTTIVDGRVTHANAQRFPEANEILVGKPTEILPKMVIDNRTAIVLMTHNYQYDLAMLESLLTVNLPYIGLLGPSGKRNRILSEIQDKGVDLATIDLNKLYGPTGLNLGAETADQIALSICAEIMAVIHEKEPIHLKLKDSPIHSGQ
ncbi:MAG: alanine dehydrogenase [Chitinophagaceae bacterium BSSC1]|nr:MAG: alanine dehydrogenase [Chitinophagaceae bacterium BSSC1]